MHLGVPLGPPLGHKNLLSGQAIAVQFASSLLSKEDECYLTFETTLKDKTTGKDV